NRKIETDAIRNKLISREGAPFSQDTVRQDIQELFNLGFFYDVQVSRNEGPNVVLTYNIVEKPSIVEIEYSGNSEIDDDELADTTGIKAYELLDQSKIKEAVEKLEKLYEDKGFFLARVNTTVLKTEKDDEVKLRF